MKIAYLSYNLFPSHYAHTIQILKMCQAFTKVGHRVTLYAQKSETFINEDELFDEYLIYETFKIKWKILPQKTWLFRLSLLLKIFFLVIANKYDLYYTRNTLISFLLTKLNKRVILELHNTAISKLERILIPIIIKSPTKIVTISRVLAEILAKTYNVSTFRFVIEHDAFDLEEMKLGKPHKLQFPQKLNKKFVMYVGSFYPGRGIEFIIELAKHFKNYYFLCIGGNDKLIENIHSKVEDLSNIFLYNKINHSRVAAVLKEADILLMPYANVVTVEGSGDSSRFMSPMKVGEYLSAGKPIIASKLPSLMEILIDNENALLSEPGNLEDWRNNLSQLLNNQKLRIKISKGAINTVKKLTWENRVENILKN